MLVSLSIHNFAIIEDLDVQFTKDMSILTGETGAGKSILIDALSLLLGERSSFEKIRVGALKAQIEGEFEIQKEALLHHFQETYGEDIIPDAHLNITRILDSNGRSSLRVNGVIFPISKAKEMMLSLIDIHSQNQNLLLLDEKNHLDLLDAFAHHHQPLDTYQIAYQEYLKEKEKEENFQKTCLTNEDIEEIQEQMKELEDANIEVGEMNQLEEERNRLLSLQKILESANHFEELIEGESGALTQLYLAKKELERSGDTTFLKFSEQIGDIYYALEDIQSNVTQEVDSLQGGENRLEFIDDRLYFLKRLVKKYQTDEEGLLTKKQELEEKLYQAEHFDTLYHEQKKKTQAAYQEVLRLGQALKDFRKQKAHELEKEIASELLDLALENASFKVEILDKEPSIDGLDRVCFLLSTNKGTPLMPLKMVASGGETSRVMLALKAVFCKLGTLETIIFDEIDTGVSGRVAMHVAKKMRQMSSWIQVIAISHLPQVAAASDHHYYVEKHVENDVTKSSIRLLNEKERIEEIAKMISGEEITDSSKVLAKELMKEAHQA